MGRERKNKKDGKIKRRKILGIQTHETMLGYRDRKIVVACKDFVHDEDRLLEMRTLKNQVIGQDEYLGESGMSVTGDMVDLTALLQHLRKNPIIQRLAEPESAERHFWETALVDIYIDNKDRDNGNRGLLYHSADKSYTIAPVYDNGNSFSTKASVQQLERYLEEPSDKWAIRMTGSRTPYILGEHLLSAKKFLSLNEPGLRQAVKDIVPEIQNKQKEIDEFIAGIPAQYRGIPVCGEVQKEF